jgi:Xaa-Pro dipeptidase
MTPVYAERVGRVTALMQEEGLDQLIITSTPSVFYLTGLWIEPHERMLALYLSGGELTLFGNVLFAVDPGVTPFACILHSDNDNPVEQLAKVIKPGTIGVDKFWPSQFLLALLNLRPDLRPRVGSAPVDRARMCKDRAEIELMRHASAMNDQALAFAIGQLKSGCTETETAAALAAEYYRLGADFPVGTLIVCFGRNAADPHHIPGAAALQDGDCIIIDIFASFNRYWCDMTRTVFLGSVNREEEKIYELACTASDAALRAIKPGVPLRAIDAAARGVIAGAGYGDYFFHRLGHGIGLECHEPPDCSTASAVVAEPGMIFSVEPGIYLPGKYGVRVEDLVLVTADGCEVLNRYPKELMVVGCQD